MRSSCRALVSLASLILLASCGRPAGCEMPPLDEADESAFAVSLIRLDAENARGAQANEKLLREAYEALRSGTPFAEVAQRFSDDPSKADGGFMGFVPARNDTAFAGAVQALPPGRYSLPFATKLGATIVFRHSFDEGMELDRRLAVPLLGFAVPFGGESHRTREQAEGAAREALAAIAKGELTLGQARERYAGDDRRRQGDDFLGTFRRRPETAVLFDTVKGLAPGEYAPAFSDERAWFVVKRAEPLMALVRHIYVGHAGADASFARTKAEAHRIASEVLNRVRQDRSLWDRQVLDYSDDTRSRGVGGKLPLLQPGTSDPEFEEAVRAVGRDTIVPRVIDTPHGSHVIWRIR